MKLNTFKQRIEAAHKLLKQATPQIGVDVRTGLYNTVEITIFDFRKNASETLLYSANLADYRSDEENQQSYNTVVETLAHALSTLNQ